MQVPSLITYRVQPNLTTSKTKDKGDQPALATAHGIGTVSATTITGPIPLDRRRLERTPTSDSPERT